MMMDDSSRALRAVHAEFHLSRPVVSIGLLVDEGQGCEIAKRGHSHVQKWTRRQPWFASGQDSLSRRKIRDAPRTGGPVLGDA